MESLDYWRLCDSFNIIQAALLIVGEDPSSTQEYVEQWDIHERPKGYEAVKASLQTAAYSGQIKIYSGGEYLDSVFSQVEWCSIYIHNDEIKRWLESRGITTGFFFHNRKHHLPYLDQNHPQYAPKLAAAIKAWEEVTQNKVLLRNKSPKQALQSWLESNSTKFGLSPQAIEEIAKVANWNTKGGAPKTPSGNLDTGEEFFEFEGEIPF